MFGRSKQLSKPFIGLRPFVLKIKDGFLIGLATPPEKGSPCVDCVVNWLKLRDVQVEKAEISDLNIRRDMLGELIAENSNQVLYEISRLGEVTRLDTIVFPSPSCACADKPFLGTSKWSKDTNFAFSPIYQLKCVRYGTPNGNIWMTSATGDAPVSGRVITTYGVHRDRESSRHAAVENWLKLSASQDLSLSSRNQFQVTAENFQTGELHSLETRSLSEGAEGTGVGMDRESAIIDALHQFAKTRTIRKFSNRVKNPMLVVGANNWIRQKVPFFLLQQYDLHLLFYPNSTPSWVVGVAALSRVRSDEAPVFMFASGGDIGEAFDSALQKLLTVAKPSDWRSSESEVIAPSKLSTPRVAKASKLNMWWTHWIYRCPKISLKDVLHLEPYAADINRWKAYFQDGQEPLSIISLNSETLPRGIRYVVKIQAQSHARARYSNVTGLGTWKHFTDASL